MRPAPRRTWRGRAPALASVLVALVVLGAVAVARSAGPDGGGEPAPAVQTIQVGGGVSLTLRVPDAPGPHPVLVHVPGGGWTEIDATPVGAAFGHDDSVADGWALATVRYRTGDDGASSDITAAVQADDVTAALAWLRESGPGLGLGPATVAMGHSAGAHLLALATARAPRALQPDALVLVAGVYDFVDDVRESPMLRVGLRDVIRCEGDGCPSRALLEPAWWADPLDPPAVVIHGAEDPVAPAASAKRYVAALRGAGVRTSLHLLEDAGHRGGDLDATVRTALRRAMRQATEARSNR